MQQIRIAARAAGGVTHPRLTQDAGKTRVTDSLSSNRRAASRKPRFAAKRSFLGSEIKGRYNS